MKDYAGECVASRILFLSQPLALSPSRSPTASPSHLCSFGYIYLSAQLLALTIFLIQICLIYI